MVPWHVFRGFGSHQIRFPECVHKNLAAKPLNIFESCLTNPKQHRQWSSDLMGESM